MYKILNKAHSKELIKESFTKCVYTRYHSCERSDNMPNEQTDDVKVCSNKDEDKFCSQSNMKALRHSFEQEKDGKIVTKTMEELEALADKKS